MILYWAGCLASVLIASLGMQTEKGKEHREAVIFFSALPLALIAALRYDVGEDYLSTYVAYFESVSNAFGGNYSRLEILYHLLNVAVAACGGDSAWVFVFSAVIFFSAVYAQVFRDSPNPALSIFLLVGMNYYFVFFNAMRQMIGCGVLLFSIRYIQKKDLLRFLLCVAVAAGFHISCALFAVVYWVGRIRIRPAAAWVMTGLLVLFSGPMTWLMRQIIAMTPYSIYLYSVFDTGETAYVMLAINAVLLAFASVCYQDERDYQIYFNLQIAALWITILSGKIVLILRLLWMFGLPSIILCPKAVLGIPDKRDRRIAEAAIVLAYFLYTMYTVGIQNSNSVLPYQTVLRRWGV